MVRGARAYACIDASGQRLGLVGSGLVSVDRVAVCGLGAAESLPAVLLRIRALATGAAVRCVHHACEAGRLQAAGARG